MPADTKAGSVEVIAERYAKNYYGDTEYRLDIEVTAQMNDGNITGYKVRVDGRKWIDYGEW